MAGLAVVGFVISCCGGFFEFLLGLVHFWIIFVLSFFITATLAKLRFSMDLSYFIASIVLSLKSFSSIRLF